jgi:hypothetical protein
MIWVKDDIPRDHLYSVQNGGHAMPLAGDDLDRRRDLGFLLQIA